MLRLAKRDEANSEAPEPPSRQNPASLNASPCSVLRTAFRIVETLPSSNLLYVAVDDARALALAECVRALAPEACTVYLPATDALPGDDVASSPVNAGLRTAALRRIRLHTISNSKQPLACIVSAECTMQRLSAPDAFDIAPPILQIGSPLDLASFEDFCIELGYLTDDRIDEPGEVAVRGSVVDIYPVDQLLPVRIEVADDVITAIKTYDPVDQRTIEEIAEIEIGRANEPEARGSILLLDHLANVSIVEESRVDSRRKSFALLAKDAAKFGRSITQIAEIATWNDAKARHEILDWQNDDAEPVSRFVESRSPLAAFAKSAKAVLEGGGAVTIVGSARDLRFLRPRLSKRLKRDVPFADGLSSLFCPGSVLLVEAPADAGFHLADRLVVAAADIMGSRAMTTKDAKPAALAELAGIADLHVGDIIVHEDHGIACLTGIEAMPGGSEGTSDGDAFALEFASGARRLVTASDANRIWRYGGEAEAISLDRLDGSTWQKRRKQIDVALAKSAKLLVELASEREALITEPIIPQSATYERFANSFAFTETPDQARAIAAVRDDLASGKPTDRLVIGDVGYGKTEVALRAAAMVALAGGQVVFAAPTTVLVRQHFELFAKRFEEFDIQVASLSRLSTATEKKAVAAGLAAGSIQIVIGTAAVAAKAVSYKNLQLVIIDEEQRFGNADKSKLRSLHDGHVVTLSATPIPRTLQFALIGLQQMSVIATPPARRQPIRSVVKSWDDAMVRTALLRERARHGQSFVVVPRIDDMPAIEAKLAKLFPEGEVISVHGKMPMADLDTAMTEFAAGRGDVLLATNIIEAGLDVPRANTMIVWRADRFGLSQLHQLRGRVGRGSRRGQILLLTDSEAKIADATLKRLRTLQAFDRLGAGFAISARDLDVRGAGDLLGDSQTGHMQLIGVDLYQHMLGQALRMARGEKVDDWRPELRLGLAGCFPKEWIPDVDIRIQLYARLARLESSSRVDSFEAELEDRFGELPEPVQALLMYARIVVLAHEAQIARVDAGPAAIAFTSRHEIANDSGMARSGDRLIRKELIEDPIERATRVAELLEEFAAA